MRVVGIRRQVNRDRGLADAIRPMDELNDALNEADFVVIALPLTEETRGLIGERELGAMKKTAFLNKHCSWPYCRRERITFGVDGKAHCRLRRRRLVGLRGRRAGRISL